MRRLIVLIRVFLKKTITTEKTCFSKELLKHQIEKNRWRPTWTILA